ncbi:hypothetical protein BACT_1085 [Bifidobacterium actinocoloniiforme DSM 22766]|uniref:Uncharacterized protein n=1 Tax=Bifidobacterium actinocoloniiforme DSM 22766 TaxID=1437605 RepID=A0A086Z1I3_9BIFI|nr:hypothetical protein [Bifidobacterium actinocoloniiforme]AKV55521.1 hypothetical protein AB656_04040 [Bifidobacterium actinocoloniiforme DSM 22766]KFI40383.1 hypothetical protein BACT_1085 [Bifidobacterium actinocoloniiforme DSM 22766]
MTIINYGLTLTSPFHHGAGTQGNTSILRTQTVHTPDGRIAQVPFLSANSIRHGLRNALAWETVKTLQVEPGSLTKGQTDLLFTGGAVTEKGAQTDLEAYRQAARILPWLTMLGYASKSDIIEGTLRASDAILACAENRGRLRDTDDLKPAGYWRSEEFGTRMDQATSPIAALMDMGAEAAGSTQMIYSVQTLSPGARLEGSLELSAAATDMDVRMLKAALDLWAPDGKTMLAAKTGTGYGRATITADTPYAGAAGDLRGIISDNKPDILGLLEALA